MLRSKPADAQAALDALVEAVAELAESSQRLSRRLHEIGLLSDAAATGLLARQDQTDAEIRRLRELRSEPRR
ncbi:hypothetical protein Asp14428_56520 [Actinoplanes sp. NBRC 14428]|uniref:Uncharacterized protein n=1 Tax=Pseudosporangium ferrugineum TaxID=439699 RepID=A0A2T0RDK7_9ACTN|nr:hypothetical protein [Pseudosporangium ferrugineum]PRY19248.1 hypothetical protein CLV70_13611 [Pseudosporangium ferrugineum]BCJ54177.1 hypothetical protein Asp14428_56520 [Actinoplanes sp. NBRC 14428]